ncbi:MAG: sulfatase-like hydrolase/transferase, partial [Pseudomonadota bacterium]
MFKKIALGLLIFIAIAGTVIWLNRATILTTIVLNRAEAAKEYIAPHQPVTWQQGPSDPGELAESRPPNIVFILLDDFGYNDLSTFGGGVADGRVPTPNIDRLAAEGAIYSQAYSGTGTCAPSRAMLMTGRYPTRTGFEFTPTPDGMSNVIATIANGRSRPHVPNVIPNRDV